MSSNYTEFCEKIDGIKKRLNICYEKLKGIGLEEKEKYENPQYRMWSGDLKNLENFTAQLEEWLSQPLVAEAKRCLSDLKNWSESLEEISIEEIEKDWVFLSDNLEEIKDIHKQIKNIEYENIKEETSTWVLKRIKEKDIEKAKNWATNANKFANSLKQLEDNKKVESKLAEYIKKDSIEELLKVKSFDKDNEDKIIRYQEIIDKAEKIVINKPEEIGETAILKTYSKNKKDMEIEENLSSVSGIIEKIKYLLIDSEWIKEFPNFEDYNTLWKEKQDAIKKDDLETIRNALGDAIPKANTWKDSKKEGINNVLSRTERMAKNVEKDELKNKFRSLRNQAEVINWEKPDVESIHNIVYQINTLRKQLREELSNKLLNEDAISIIEEPEIIENLGYKSGWDFDRFFKALEVVLRKGIIEIRIVDENERERRSRVS